MTAGTGAAIRDIMNISARRNPYVQLVLYPALVQGERAKHSIVKGIETLDAMGLDVIIVGRGGGSIEDLWAFNEEMVARAIFNCSTPVISAVGHETDVTIADYVADLRAPTPSAAAELAVYDYGKLSGELAEAKVRLSRLMRQKIQLERLRMREYQTKLKYLHPEHKLREQQQRLSDMEDRLRAVMQGKLTDARHRLAVYVEMMKGLSPVGKLNQGYSYVQGTSGRAVKSIRDIKADDRLSIYVTDGIIHAVVDEVKEVEHG